MARYTTGTGGKPLTPAQRGVHDTRAPEAAVRRMTGSSVMPPAQNRPFVTHTKTGDHRQSGLNSGARNRSEPPRRER
jgi:hypothetical protein